jgi:hypothetical protein
MYNDLEIKSFLRSGKSYDLIVLDGAFPECAMGIVYRFKLPFIFINTVAFYSMPFSYSGSSAPFSVTPFFGRAYTDNMGLLDRAGNTAWHLVANALHRFSMILVQGVLRKNFGPQIPNVYDMTKNVSFILQNGHHSVSYPRSYLPNVAEVACIHCKEAKRLSPVSTKLQ